MTKIEAVAQKINALIRESVKNRAKLDQENAALHKTSEWLAEQARNTERAMDRKRWERA